MSGKQGDYPTEEQWHEIWLRHPATPPGLTQDESSQVYTSLGIDPRHAKSAGRWGYVTLTEHGRVRGSGVGPQAMLRVLEWAMRLPDDSYGRSPSTPAPIIVCPTCDADAVPVIYGYPMDAAMRAGEAGALAFGGCVVSDDMPNWQCGQGHRWSDADVPAWRTRLDSVLAPYRSPNQENGEPPR